MSAFPTAGLFTIASYPGVNSIISFDYTFTHGIVPGIATIVCVPQETLPASDGDLVFSDNNGNTITLSNCHCDSTSFQLTPDGFIWQLSLMDRRYWWRFGKINGAYNIRKKTNLVWSVSAETPQSLAYLCLERMGETNINQAVSNMASLTGNPAANWYGANPAQELQNLCDTYGMAVVLHLDNSITIEPKGTGALLPSNNGVTRISIVADPPNMPDVFNVICGPTRYQADFFLDPVGEDKDGTVQRLSDLSYAPFPNMPYGGFELENASFEHIKDLDLRRRAEESIWKWYRVQGMYGIGGQFYFANRGTPNYNVTSTIIETNQSGGGYTPIHVSGIDWITFEDTQVDQGVTLGKKGNVANDNNDVNLPSWVFGIWWDDTERYDSTSKIGRQWEGILQPITNADPDSTYAKNVLYSYGHSIDKDEAIVKFGRPVYAIEAGVRTAATLILRTAFTLRDFFTNQFVHYEVTKTMNGLPNSLVIQTILKEEIRRKYSLQYSVYANGASTTGFTDNTFSSPDGEAVVPQCGYYIGQEIAKYQRQTNSASASYVGLRPDIDMDGAICQMNITGGVGEGCSTTVNRNVEGLPNIIPYRELFLLRQSAAMTMAEKSRRAGEWAPQAAFELGRPR